MKDFHCTKIEDFHESMKDIFSEFDQIRSLLRIPSSFRLLMENLIFCAVFVHGA